MLIVIIALTPFIHRSTINTHFDHCVLSYHTSWSVEVTYLPSFRDCSWGLQLSDMYICVSNISPTSGFVADHCFKNKENNPASSPSCYYLQLIFQIRHAGGSDGDSVLYTPTASSYCCVFTLFHIATPHLFRNPIIPLTDVSVLKHRSNIGSL